MTRPLRRRLAAAGLFLLAGMALWFVPGVKFSACLSAGAAALFLLSAALLVWSGRSRAGRTVRRVFQLCLLLGAALFACLEGAVLLQGTEGRTAQPADAVVVLGAGVNGTTPSLALRTRIDAAADYLETHPDIPVVLSGGQGPGEDVTEARAMYEALTARGADPARLLLEERSTSTAENFACSKELLARAGVDVETAAVAVVTNDFHICRARLLAGRQGLDMVGVPASLPWAGLTVNYYVREAFALVKTFLLD